MESSFVVCIIFPVKKNGLKYAVHHIVYFILWKISQQSKNINALDTGLCSYDMFHLYPVFWILPSGKCSVEQANFLTCKSCDKTQCGKLCFLLHWKQWAHVLRLIFKFNRNCVTNFIARLRIIFIFQPILNFNLDCWVFGLCPSYGIVRKNNVTKTGSVFVLSDWG
jgi:hypothetical protein